MITIATMLWDPTDQSYDFSCCYSEEWVHRLYDGFARNLTIPFKFCLFTDRERELGRPIEQHLFERRPIDYGSCIEPFKLPGPKIVVGLDTVVTGSVDAIAQWALEGKAFLLPIDPYDPNRACNGVAVAPDGLDLWSNWNGENDMDWCRSFPHQYLDHVFPGFVQSYKGAVLPNGLGDARIVYFHGHGKPHELSGVEWINRHWGPIPNQAGKKRSGWQSAVMAWEAGTLTELWEDWVAMGSPLLPGGDQAWIESRLDRADFWQDLYPGKFTSYKGSVAPAEGSVICFHGVPRPHEVNGWASKVWQVGGITRAELAIYCNTSQDVYMANVRRNVERDIPWFDFGEMGAVAIVGGGPSVTHAVEEIRYRAQIGQEIWALNGAFRWLVDRGINPTAQVIIDARPDDLQFIMPTKGVRYYLASQCDPSLFDALEGYDVVLLHCHSAGVEDFLSGLKTDKPIHLIGGGTTVLTKAMVMADMLKAPWIHLYGVDSSFEDAHHAYDQSLNDGDSKVVAHCEGREFRTSPWMVQQVNDFQLLVPHLTAGITVNGDGLLPHVARHLGAAHAS